MTLESKHGLKFTIVKDKETSKVWINGPVNCLGRFSPLGYEINRRLDATLKGEELQTATLSVKICNLVPKDWENFKTLMMESHEIDLSDVPNPLLWKE